VRKLLLIGGASALIALPATALAVDTTAEPVPETDPTAEDLAGATTTTDKALHVEGRGAFRYEGSGGIVIAGGGVVRVTDLSAGKDLVRTPTGFGTTTTKDGGVTIRYVGEGTLTLDGSSYRVTANGRFTSDVDPTATHAAAGTARVAGSGQSILKGGIPVPFWASQRILLATGPMAVDLAGRGGPEWWRDAPGGRKGAQATRVVLKRKVVTRRTEDGRVVTERTVVTVKRWWRWDHRSAGATWRLNGPANGAVDLTAVTGRIRVWDRSAAKDLTVTVPGGTTTTTLSDGSAVYAGLKGAAVKLSGTGFRMKVRGTDVVGTFTPAEGSLARSFVRGKGTFDAGAATDVSPGRHGGVRVLLQPAAATTPK